MPAPKGNTNALRHGLTVGILPRGCGRITRTVNQFRSELEAAALEIHGGTLGPAESMAIHTACRWERHALLAGRWLRRNYDELNHDQRLHYSREIAKASSERDKAIAPLKLARTGTGSAWDAVDAANKTPAINGTNGHHANGSAPEAKPANQNGNGNR